MVRIDPASLRYAGQELVIALSGGRDSVSLLHYIKNLNLPNKILAIHINHNLQPDSVKFEQFCINLCKSWDIDLIIKRWDKINYVKKQSPEEFAREIRYELISEAIQNINNPCVLFAHHAGDQAETVLFRLLRGAGIKGLAGMPEYGNKPFLYHRPFLNITPEQIQKYVQQNNLDYIEDLTNFDLKFDRNFLRNKIIPELKTRWPGLENNIVRTSKICRDTEKLISAKNHKIYNKYIDINNKTLDFKNIKNYGQALRYWFEKLEVKKMPSHKHILEIINCVILAKPDRKPEFKLNNYIIKRFSNKLYLLEKNSSAVGSF